MKVTIKIKMIDGSTKEITGSKRKLKLKSGEVIDVVVDKRKDEILGDMWFVTHVESGLALVPNWYYCYPRMLIREECDLDPITAKNALDIVKYEFDKLYKEKGIKFYDKWNSRETELKGKTNE